MTLKQVNKALAKLNPYTQKAEIRKLQKLRRELVSIKDIMTGNVPESLKRQAN